jgi:hypothetical protein
MGVGVVLNSALVVYSAYLAAFRPMKVEGPLKWGIQLGLLFLMLSFLDGGLMMWLGSHMMSSDRLQGPRDIDHPWRLVGALFQEEGQPPGKRVDRGQFGETGDCRDVAARQDDRGGESADLSRMRPAGDRSDRPQRPIRQEIMSRGDQQASRSRFRGNRSRVKPTNCGVGG